MRVLVLSGGKSPEREVSIKSGKSVSEALKIAGYKVSEYDPSNGDNGLFEAVNANDVIFPVLHGINGEDGVVQKKLEQLNATYIGSDSISSEITFFKDKTHIALGESGILMPNYQLVGVDDINHKIFKKPFVLKPVDGGSSIDTLIARKINIQVLSQATGLLTKHKIMIVEELIEGQEITVPILGNDALPVIAIIPPNGKEFDFINKYNGKSKEICPVPFNIVSKKDQATAQDLSIQVHNALGARHYSRIDMILSNDNRLYVLELNSIPGLTPQSLYPNSANVAGYNMVKLVSRLVELAVSK